MERLADRAGCRRWLVRSAEGTFAAVSEFTGVTLFSSGVEPMRMAVGRAMGLEGDRFIRILSDGFEEHGWYCVVSEASDGVSLEELLSVAPGGRLPAATAAALVRDAAIAAFDPAILLRGLDTHALVLDSRGRLRLDALALVGVDRFIGVEDT